MHTFVPERRRNPLCPGLAKQESIAHTAPFLSHPYCAQIIVGSQKNHDNLGHMWHLLLQNVVSPTSAQKGTWNKDVFALLQYLPPPRAASSPSSGRNLDLPFSERCCECRRDELRGWPTASGGSRKQGLAREKKGDDRWGTREEQTWRQRSTRDLQFELVLPTWPPRFTETRLMPIITGNSLARIGFIKYPLCTQDKPQNLPHHQAAVSEQLPARLEQVPVSGEVSPRQVTAWVIEHPFRSNTQTWGHRTPAYSVT